MQALQRPSPNFGPRRNGLSPSMVVLHYTAMSDAAAALDRLCDPRYEVSAHYLIGRCGTLWQLVDERQRAWHAGAGNWAGQGDINSRSIGIELDNAGDHPFAARQMTVLETLLSQIMARWNIAPQAVIGHSDMAPGRKQDPGRHFDWARLARQGLAVGQPKYTAVDEVSAKSFRIAAQQAGFTSDVSDEVLLSAVRLRHRPWAKGPLLAADFYPLTGRVSR